MTIFADTIITDDLIPYSACKEAKRYLLETPRTLGELVRQKPAWIGWLLSCHPSAFSAAQTAVFQKLCAATHSVVVVWGKDLPTLNDDSKLMGRIRSLAEEQTEEAYARIQNTLPTNTMQAYSVDKRLGLREEGWWCVQLERPVDEAVLDREANVVGYRYVTTWRDEAISIPSISTERLDGAFTLVWGRGPIPSCCSAYVDIPADLVNATLLNMSVSALLVATAKWWDGWVIRVNQNSTKFFQELNCCSTVIGYSLDTLCFAQPDPVPITAQHADLGTILPPRALPECVGEHGEYTPLPAADWRVAITEWLALPWREVLTKKEMVARLIESGAPKGLAEQIASGPRYTISRDTARIAKVLDWALSVTGHDLGEGDLDSLKRYCRIAVQIACTASIGGNRGLGIEGPSQLSLIARGNPAVTASNERVITILGGTQARTVPTQEEVRTLVQHLITLPHALERGLLANFCSAYCAAAAEDLLLAGDISGARSAWQTAEIAKLVPPTLAYSRTS